MPVVSVIVPAFNAEATLVRAIDSVLRQTFSDIELIVCNDGSSDRTAAILEGYGTQVITATQPNRGRGAARNSCLKRSTGEFIALLDADDWWMPRKLEIQLEEARKHPASDVFYGNSYIVSGGGLIYRTMNGRWHVGHSGFVYPYLVRNNFVPTSTVLVRSKAVEEAGHFNETLPRCQDLEWFLRLAARTRFHYTNSILGYYDDRTWSTPDKHPDTYGMFIRVLDIARAAHSELAEKYSHHFAKSYSDCYSELARHHEQQEQHALAAEQYRLALDHTPRSRILEWKRALALYKAGELEACEVAFLRILEGDPYDTEAHFYLGNIRLAQERAAEAKEQFELSLYGGYLYQQFPECVNNLGVSCARLGELHRARELFEQAAQQQEFYSDSLWNMQYLQEGVGVERLKWTRRKVF